MAGDRIFVTGATGFVGRRLVPRLLAGGHALTLAVREPARCPPDWRNDPRIAIAETGALEDPAAIGQAVQDALAIIHLAGLATVSAAPGAGAESLFMRANAETTARLAEAAEKASIGCFIHMSSVFAVSANALPEIVSDATPPAPDTAYGRSKLAAERHVANLAAAGVFALSLRPPLVVGAEAKGNWAALQKLAASGLPLPFASLRNRRSLIGVDTLAEAVARLVSKRWPGDASGVYSVADPEILSMAEVIAELRHGMNTPPRLFPVPGPLLDAIGKAAGRKRQLAALTGDLVVDPSRFLRRFDLSPAEGLRQEIRNSGAAYIAGLS